ncbi:MAG: hypothetical protein Q9182_007000 [Xanthomendoza sp. 2 TL-2023]
MSFEGLSEIHGPEIPQYHSTWDLFTEGGLRKNPEGQAIVVPWQPADHLSSWTLKNAVSTAKSSSESDCLSWTYIELQSAVEQLASVLWGNGVRRGSRIAAFLSNSVEWCLFFWACARLTACFCPLNPDSAQRPQELHRLLELLKADAIVVQDSDQSTEIEKNAPHLVRSIALKIACGPVPNEQREHWTELSTLQPSQQLPQGGPASSGNDPTLILFTSGTTGVPKACAHSAMTLGSGTHSNYKLIDKSHRCLFDLRNFHIVASLTLLYWRAGAAVVFPSKEFDPTATLQALRSQCITHLHATPSTIYALLDHPLFDTNQPQHLLSLTLTAEIISTDLLHKCKEQLRIKRVLSGWGMTEGIGLINFGYKIGMPLRGGILAVGEVLPGVKVRICQPGTRIPVKRGDLGEIHCGGNPVIRGYLEDDAHTAFYSDNYGHWFVTGDQASMDDDGTILIHGRYKDIIIRGGENISPVTIEVCLNSQANVKVVGIADPVMGEAPVAVVKTPLAQDLIPDLKSALRELVLLKLGTSFALVGVYTLAELGMDEFPLTASRKVSKRDLRSKVIEHISRLNLERSQENRGYPMLSQVRDIWAQLLGRLPENVGSSMRATEVADSLTIMRFCHDIEKQTGHRLTIADIRENPTVDRQARLLERKDRGRSFNDFPKTRQSSDPPSAKDMIFVDGDEVRAAQTARCAQPALEALHLTWKEDVEDAYLNTDAMRSHWSNRQRPASFNIRWVLRVKHASLSRVREALEKTLGRHATLRSVLVYLGDGTPIHLIVRPSKHWFDECIEEGDPVPTVEHAGELLGRMDLGFGGPPAPLFRAYVMQIESSGEVGLILSINHTAYDAFSLRMFFEDLDLHLSHDAPDLEDRVPFKLFADTYHLHQSGAAASASIDFQVKRLKGISQLSDAFWPVAQGPEWLHGNDAGWTTYTGRPGRPGERLSYDREENRPEGRSIWRKDTIPSLAGLKIDRSIEPSILVKTAIALYNTEVTSQQHAVFCNLEAGRSWPFLEAWIADRLPNPMKIAGPTVACTINVIPVDKSASVGALLRRTQEEQTQLSEHAHAPISVVKQQLGERDGRVMDDVGRRQVFNWDPSRRRSKALASLETLGRQGWPDYGFFWNFGLQDERTLVGFVMYDDAHLRQAQAKAALDRVVAIVQWMAEPRNWETAVGNVGSSVDGVSLDG